jgi:hypothetical protein
MHTPRLAVLGPVRGLGKTTLLNVLSQLVARPHKAGSITEAAIYRLVEDRRPTLLLDELDNADLRNRHRLRAILNTGHQRGWPITIVESGAPKQFSTFCPMSFAAIGLPNLTLMHRSIRINMQRHDGSRPLKKFNLNAIGEFDVVYRELVDLAGKVKLNLDPQMPDGLSNRAADNWRPLIAAADLFGPEWGAAARQVAINMSRGADEDDRKIQLLWHIDDVRQTSTAPSIGSDALVQALLDLPDTPYIEWRGVNDDKPSRPLTQHGLADLLKAFGIRPRTVWPEGRGAGRKSCRGYAWVWFEPLMRAYPREPTHTTQPDNIYSLGVA